MEDIVNMCTCMWQFARNYKNMTVSILYICDEIYPKYKV